MFSEKIDNYKGISLGDVLTISLTRENYLDGTPKERIVHVIEKRERLIKPTMFVGMDLKDYSIVIFCLEEIRSARLIVHYGIQEITHDRMMEKISKEVEDPIKIPEIVQYDCCTSE